MIKTPKTVAECRHKVCTRDDCWFQHTKGQKPDKKTVEKTVAECRHKVCTRDDCWFQHTKGQKPDKKTKAPVIASIPEQKLVEQPTPVVAEIPEQKLVEKTAPVVAEIPDQSPELYAEFCFDDDDDDQPIDESDFHIAYIGAAVYLCFNKKKLKQILDFIISHLYTIYGVNYDNDEDFYDDHTDLSYYREKIISIANDPSLPYNDLVFIREIVLGAMESM